MLAVVVAFCGRTVAPLIFPSTEIFPAITFRTRTFCPFASCSEMERPIRDRLATPAIWIAAGHDGAYEPRTQRFTTVIVTSDGYRFEWCTALCATTPADSS
jgi:hypothetical protein